VSAVTAKYAPAALPVLTAALAAHSDTLWKIGAVIGGLILGAMWRAGSLRGDGKSWAMVRSDLGVSGLIGGANAVLTLALVQAFQMNVMFAMAIAVIVGATGLRALPEIKAGLIGYARRKLIGNDIAVVHPNDPDLDELVRKMRAKDRAGDPGS
jgi:hypothetical protein